MISGPGNLAISDAERTSVVSAVTTGYQFWTGVAPEYANLRFHLIYTHLTVSTPDIIGTCNGWDCDEGFTNDALKLMGFQSRPEGEDALAQFYKDISGSDGAYFVFATKYKLYHTYYATRGRGPVYMQIKEDGYPPMERMFAHETAWACFQCS